MEYSAISITIVSGLAFAKGMVEKPGNAWNKTGVALLIISIVFQLVAAFGN